MRLINRVPAFCLILLLSLIQGRLSHAGGLNVPEGGGQVCEVTSKVDDEKIIGSIRRAMNMGYNVQDSSLPSFCKQKIVFKSEGTYTLREPIELNNKAASGFILEKDPSVTGEVILDGTAVNGCAIILDSNQVTVRGLSIRNAKGGGICIKTGSNGNIIDQVTVTRSGAGVKVESGSQNNLIQNGSFYDNSGPGVELGDATQNKVTKNGLYRNTVPVVSPATDIQPTINSAAPTNSAATQYTISGTLPNSVEHCEIFRGAPKNGTSNYITDIIEFSALSFITTVDAQSGEELFLVCIAPDGTTSPSSTAVKLTTVGTGNGNGNGGPRPCFPGQVFPPTADFDGDGIPDYIEDKPMGEGKGGNCIVDPGETDPTNPDTDGDTISDGIEDRNKNGQMDSGETDPTKNDTDGDFVTDEKEDKDHDGIRDSDEMDPTKADTDGDGIPDGIEDANRNGLQDEGETSAILKDTDFDGLEDGEEDSNADGVHDQFRESDPRVKDTDDDGLFDKVDTCPNNPVLTCKVPCIPGVEPSEELDNDGDLIPDYYEDLNHDCVVDSIETDPFKKDSDGDGKNDRIDACPKDPDPTCEAFCDPENINPFLDSDGDGLKNSEEDLNGNCLVDPLESNPFDNDTDDDGVTDGNDKCPLDKNPLCESPCTPGVPKPSEQDSDGDGIPDANEDINENCIQDAQETSYQKRDTDNDGINDNNDPCPLNADQSCPKECVPGEFIPPQRDSDRDGIKDVLEDTNRDCIRQQNETDAYNADTDGDLLPDGLEDKNQNGVLDADETDPRVPDSDGDGIPDGVEDKNQNGKVDFDELNPLSTDTDSDGISDFFEDKNLNGVWDAGETNGARKDTDADGLEDGAEDVNHNGQVDAGETDPRNPDTDGDGANDGQEFSNGTNPINGSQSDFNRALGRGCSLTPGADPVGFYWVLLGLIPLWWSVRRR